MAYVQWIAVPMVVAILLGLLVWGMRRIPRDRRLEIEAEIASDDPPADKPSRTTRGGRTTILEQRRLLTALWREAVPDLLVSFWKTPGAESRMRSCYSQAYLPVDNRLDGVLSALENLLFERATEQGIPERSQFIKSYTFLRLIDAGQDLVVESRFVESRFVHEFHLLDADGKMSPVAAEADLTSALLEAARLVPYRMASDSLTPDEQAAMARDHFSRMSATEAVFGIAHAWLAHLGSLAGDDRDSIRRHAALALEFAPTNQIARLEWRRLQGESALEGWIHRINEFITLNSENEDHTRFLVSQSLVALNQPAVARAFCEKLLLDSPGHLGASRLLRMIDQKERGAQT